DWLQERQNLLKSSPDMVGKLKRTLEYIDQVMAPLDSAKMASDDAAIITNEFQVAAKMLRHGAKRLLVMYGDPSVDVSSLQRELDESEKQYRAQWLVRNRPG